MRDKDVIKMVSLIQEISIKRYGQQRYVEIVQEIYSAFQIGGELYSQTDKKAVINK